MKFWDKRTSGPIKAISPMTGKAIEVDPQKDAKISSDLDKELHRQPALLHWYMALRDVAEERWREAMYEEHCAEEDLSVVARVAQPKATESTIKMVVRTKKRMRDTYRRRMDAETMLNRLKSAVAAIDAKAYSLASLAKSSSMERKTRDFSM